MINAFDCDDSYFFLFAKRLKYIFPKIDDNALSVVTHLYIALFVRAKPELKAPGEERSRDEERMREYIERLLPQLMILREKTVNNHEATIMAISTLLSEVLMKRVSKNKESKKKMESERNAIKRNILSAIPRNVQVNKDILRSVIVRMNKQLVPHFRQYLSALLEYVKPLYQKLSSVPFADIKDIIEKLAKPIDENVIKAMEKALDEFLKRVELLKEKYSQFKEPVPPSEEKIEETFGEKIPIEEAREIADKTLANLDEIEKKVSQFMKNEIKKAEEGFLPDVGPVKRALFSPLEMAKSDPSLEKKIMKEYGMAPCDDPMKNEQRIENNPFKTLTEPLDNLQNKIPLPEEYLAEQIKKLMNDLEDGQISPSIVDEGYMPGAINSTLSKIERDKPEMFMFFPIDILEDDNVQKISEKWAMAVYVALQFGGGWGTEAGALMKVDGLERLHARNIKKIADMLKKIQQGVDRNIDRHVRKTKRITRAFKYQLDDDMIYARWNRWLGIDQAFKKKAKIAVVFDKSGSMGGLPETIGRAVVLGLVDYMQAIYYFPFDTEVYGPYIVERGNHRKAFDVAINEVVSIGGYGGTDIEKALATVCDYAVKNRIKNVLLITDGIAPFSLTRKDLPSSVRIISVIVENDVREIREASDAYIIAREKDKNVLLDIIKNVL